MNTEPRIMTDKELESSINRCNQVTKENTIKEESNRLELKKKFDLTYVGEISNQRISIESENFTASIYKWDENMKIRMKCELDVKDIKTFEEFEKARSIVIAEKQRVMTAIYWCKFRFFNKDD